MDLYEREGVTPEKIHAHAHALQERFLSGLERDRPRALAAASLVTPRDLSRQGNFLTFRFEGAPALHQALREKQVETDLRGDRSERRRRRERCRCRTGRAHVRRDSPALRRSDAGCCRCDDT